MHTMTITSIRMTTLVLVASAALIGCDAAGPSAPPSPWPTELPAAEQTLSQEDREVLEEAKRRKAELRDLKANPGKYIGMDNWTMYDKGIINDYTQVTAAKLRNSSAFDVVDIEGEFEYRSRSGAVLATVPIKFRGEVRAGEVANLGASARTISGHAAQGNLVVTKLRVRE